MTDLGRIYAFPSGKDITPDPSPDETAPSLSPAARSYYIAELEHHERKARVYRKLLGMAGIEGVPGEDTTNKGQGPGDAG